MTFLQVLILVAISASLGAGLALFISLSTVVPKIETIEPPEATIIYSSDRIVLARLFREDRTNVPLKDIPKALQDATIAIEDRRFYQHSGVDMKAVARALWVNLRGHSLREGGSTITQQLARNVYLTRRKTVQRKVQEVVLAILLERHFPKKKILELYLNQVYYGSGAFGVQAAAKVYFGKNVDQLSLSECALLAGMPRKPSGYSPHENYEAAVGRRNVVLDRMFSYGYITMNQWHDAKKETVKIVPRVRGRRAYKAPHFVDYVTGQLRDRYGDDVLFSGGLRVYTTLNYQMQRIADKALRDGVHKYEKSRRVTEGCFVAVEAQNGYIRAMVGSVDPNSQFNRCTQGLGQQPGSAFKVFVYTAAFAECGLKPSDHEANTRKSYPGAGGRLWIPRNYDGRYSASVSIKTAIARSINIPAIRVAEKIGMERVIKYAHLMGIKTEIQPYLSSAIGASEVYPLEMAAAYATFANDGAYVEPMAVVRITNAKGDIIEDFEPQVTPVVTEKVNAMMDECLRAVVTVGTGRAVRDVPDARGKTGTTSDDRDAWFIGYVPRKMSAACWVGNDDNSPMRGAYGGLVCAPIWRDFMLQAIPIYDRVHSGQDKKKLARKTHAEESNRRSRNTRQEPRFRQQDEPDVVQTEDSNATEYAICDQTGMLATEHCPSHLKTFAPREQPKSYCTAHTRATTARQRVNVGAPQPTQEVTLVTVTICPDSGLLAGPECAGRVKKKIPVDEVPTQVCNIHGHGAR